MSSFDKRVCLWLNTATIPEKQKITTLNRMNVGISNYRNLGLEPAAGTSAAKAEPTVRVDYTLQDSIAKALHRMKDRQKKVQEEAKKEEKDRKSVKPLTQPLFPTITRESLARANNRTPGMTPRGSRPVTPRGGRTGSVQPFANGRTASTSSSVAAAPPAKNESPTRNAPQDDKPEVAFGGFTFGSPSDDAPPSHHEDEDDETMTAHEDERRRRLTIQKRQSRHAISAEVMDQDEASKFEGEVVAKSPEIMQRTMKSLETHHLFSFLDDVDLQRVVDIMQLKSYKRGEDIVEAQQPNNAVFVIVTGSANVSGADGPHADGEKLNVGAVFGEHGVMYESNAPQTISAAVATTQCCSIDRETYKKICSQVSQVKRERYENFLSNVKFLKGLTKHEKLQLADALKSAKYEQGDHLISYGQEGVWFNIILEGTVDVVGRDEDGKEVYVCSFGVGDCVGELEFLFKHKTVADCVAKTDVVRTAKMTAKHFETVIGSAKEVLERQAEDDEVYSYYRAAQKNANK